METLAIALVIVAAILGVVTLFQSKGTSLLGWGVVALAAGILLQHRGL